MIELAKRLASKSQVDIALDLVDKKKRKTKNFQAFDLSYFIGKSYFGNGGSQNYLIFQPIYNAFSRKAVDT